MKYFTTYLLVINILIAFIGSLRIFSLFNINKY